MNRRTDGTAGAPGVPGLRGGVAGDSAGTPAASVSSSLHRPVNDARNRAGATTAAPSRRGDSLSAVVVAPASTLDDDRTERDASAGRAEGAPLDLHEVIRDPLARGCQRWPEHLRLLNHDTGELIAGRCRATNLCRYCQTLYVVETVEMLTLDAMEHAPALWAVLTAREHLTRAECTDHLRQLRRALRNIWPAIEWFVQVEFQRRGALHLNLLVKGVAVGDAERLRDVIGARWCSRVDALPIGQWVGAIEDGVGVVRYLSKMLSHGLKAEQRPPIGWRGHRTSQTRGYLVRPASVMRDEARKALRLKRLIHAGMSPETAELELAYRESVCWSLRHARPGLSPQDLQGTYER
jgi:hypothetical protein